MKRRMMDAQHRNTRQRRDALGPVRCESAYEDVGWDRGPGLPGGTSITGSMARPPLTWINGWTNYESLRAVEAQLQGCVH